MKVPKRQIIADRAFLDTFASRGCLCCGFVGCDPCHVRSRGAGGMDEVWNIVPMCRQHHSEQHQIGWYRMSLKYPDLASDLKAKGWDFWITGRIVRTFK